jgi:hypothetical protein
MFFIMFSCVGFHGLVEARNPNFIIFTLILSFQVYFHDSDWSGIPSLSIPNIIIVQQGSGNVKRG